MILQYATQRQGIEHRARQEKTRQERRVLRASERKNKNSNKTHKNDLFPQINKSYHYILGAIIIVS